MTAASVRHAGFDMLWSRDMPHWMIPDAQWHGKNPVRHADQQ